MPASSEPSRRSVTAWAGALAAEFIIGVILYGVLAGAASAPGLFLLSLVDPLAAGLGTLAVVGMIPPLLGSDHALKDHTESTIPASSNGVTRIYVLGYLFALVAGISTLAAATATASALLYQTSDLGALSVVVAVLYPSADQWLGDHSGWNLRAIAASIAGQALAVIARGSPRASSQLRTAARDARELLAGE